MGRQSEMVAWVLVARELFRCRGTISILAHSLRSRVVRELVVSAQLLL
jgi:hypothetical protein